MLHLVWIISILQIIVTTTITTPKSILLVAVGLQKMGFLRKFNGGGLGMMSHFLRTH
jgi:hypothetical protein